MFYLKKLYIHPEHITTINMCILILIREGIFTATKCTKKLLKVGLMLVMSYDCKSIYRAIPTFLKLNKTFF